MSIFNFKKWNSVKVVLLILFLGVLILKVGNIALAQYSSPEDLTGGNLVFETSKSAIQAQGGILTLIGYITAGVLVLLGYFVDFALNLGNQVINLPLVQIGSGVILGFANLGFVLAIIVMAFATIFRVQSYAMKQTLWKLIVAALLVNFSLVIAGGVISVSNSFTNYFISQSTGTSLATGLAGVLNPQDFLDTTGGSNSSFTSLLLNGLNGLFKFIASLFFVIVFSFIIILTFFTLVIMLFIRAIYLGILLILMPIVWLAWIFPATKKHWQRWWTEFIRWNFFAPAVLFFIYLIIRTGNEMSKITQNLNVNTNNADIKNAFSAMTLNGTTFFQYAAQCVIGCGLLLGGIFVANSLGITFGSTAYGWTQSMGKSFGGWVERKGIRAGTFPFRSASGRKLTEGMQKTGLESGRLGRLITSPIRQLGTAISGASGIGVGQGEKLVTQAEQKAKKLQSQQLALGLNTASNEEQIAYLNVLRERKDLDLVPHFERYLTGKQKKVFAAYGREGNFGDLEKATGLTAQAMELAKNLDEKGTYDELGKLYQGMRPSHFSTLQADDLFGTTPKLLKDLSPEAQKIVQQQGARAILETNPDGLANIYRGLKGKNITEFHDNNLFKYINDQAKTVGLTPAEYLKKDHPKVYTFYTSPAAQGLGIGIEPVKEPVKEEKKTTLYDQFGRSIT